MREVKIITIDGPASSGKTTIARMLAKKLNYFFVRVWKFLQIGNLFIIKKF